MVYPRYSLMFPTLKEVRDSLDNSYFAAQAGVEKKAQELYAQNPREDGVQEFIVTKGLIKEYQEMTTHNFEHAADPEE